MKKYLIAIDLGGTSASLGLFDTSFKRIDEWNIKTDISQNGQLIIPHLIKSIEEKLDSNQINRNQLLGIGMGTPGTIDHKAGTVVGAYNLNWETSQPVREQFQNVFDCPVYLENDANAAALGEQWQGSGNNENNVIMVTLGTGVGGGIVIDGEVIRGAGGAAGEIGHMTIETTDAFPCTCGKIGCLETVASAPGIVRLAKKYALSYVGESVIKERALTCGDLDARVIFDAAKSGDQFAEVIADKYAEYLGLAASHLANVLNPSKIIIGGGVSAAGEYLLTLINHYYYLNTFPQVQNSTQIVLASLGNDAGLVGAARLVLLNV